MNGQFDESCNPEFRSFSAESEDFSLSVNLNLRDLTTFDCRAKSKISGRQIKVDSADFKSAIIDGLASAEALLTIDRTRINATITALQERRKQFEQEGIPK
jgi:hypothetical protein